VKFALLFLFLNFQAEARTLQVMSYNVENLFDAKHDVVDGKDKKDWTFLPKDAPGKREACRAEKNRHHKKECFDSDWTEAKVELKLSQIKEVVTKERPLPDFLGLVEVENSNVISQLAKKLGYENFEMTESPDERGVDVALLYRNAKDIKKISRMEHVVPVDYATRNILEVEFLIDEKYPLTIFVNHWPSLANPDSWRVKAAEILANRTKEILKKNPLMSVIALGDFNTIDENDPHPFKTVLFKDNLFSDVEQSFNSAKNVDEKLKKAKPPGTYYFAPKDQWNSLDHFFVNSELTDGKDLDIVLPSFEIYSPSFIVHDLKKKFKDGEEKNVKIVLAPKRFDPDGTTKETIGYSDHFPILVKLNYPDKKIKAKKK
jgi:predicted extracellular nuclease